MPMLVVAEGGSLQHATDLENYDDVRDFWSNTRVGYTPTLSVTYGGLTSEDRFYRDTESVIGYKRRSAFTIHHLD